MGKSGRKKHVRQANIVATFAQRLREVRKSRGMSQIKLALKAGIHISYIGRLERAESAAGIDTVERLANALGVNPAEMITSSIVSADSLRDQARENVEYALKKADPAGLQALAVIASRLIR